VALTSGTTVNGSLVDGDCRLLEDGSFIDAYTFTGTANAQVSITMTSSAAGLNPVLFLLAPTGAVLAIDANNSSGGTARIPDTGTFTLPTTGTYTVLANSFAPGQTGNYSLQLVNSSAPPPTCTTTLAATGRDVAAGGGGPFSVAFTTQAGCTVSATSNAAFITVNAGTVDSNGAGSVSYTVQANPATTARTGTITINGQTFTVTQAGTPPVCTTTLAATGREVPGSGATFSVAFTTQAGCAVSATSNAAFITVNAATVDGNGAGSVSYTVQLNPTAAARTGTITINGQTFTVTQAAGSTACTYAIYPTVRAFTANSSASGRFTVITQSGCQWSATTTAPWITITEGTGAMTSTGRVRYSVLANESNATRVGTIIVGGQTHTVTQTSVGTTPQIQFMGNAEFTVNENDASRAAIITVTRTGDTAGAATVEYATLDDQAAVPCDPNISNGGVAFPQGTAYARCDYATTIDTLTFNPGETTKTFTVPLINDVFQEGNETFRIGLSNPQGATLGTLTTAIVTIRSEDTAPPTTNPINQTPFFVRQQYLDFLDREPEAGEPWTAVLNRCGNIYTGPEVNTDCDRIAVSGAFFGSPEFRIKGFFVFLYYKAVFGSANNPLYVPEYNEFVRDARRVSGPTSEEVIAKRLDFTEDFFARTAVANVFSGTSNEAFVDRALANLGITLTNADPATGETRNSLVASLNSSTRSRAQVLRIIVESTEAIAAQFNRAFVAIQYYGYLRRTPEPQGYQNNLNALNATNNSRQLINGFLNSIEYRLRFGANTTNP
ncbi:MAG TPA: BACON domain-containing carbohydrate-binding protein, partial [Pyrinomonadaceae bacterium]|nr:BACON domain-containing carbohydrate-binding protein [Pyrinomonadaceae bacterium]